MADDIVVGLRSEPILVEVPSADWWLKYESIGRRAFAIYANGTEREITLDEAKAIYDAWEEARRG